MAATQWQLYNSAKKYIGNGTITLGAGVFKMVLARTSSNASTFTLSTYAQLPLRFPLRVDILQVVKT
jgi:hypothetical protein